MQFAGRKKKKWWKNWKKKFFLFLNSNLFDGFFKEVFAAFPIIIIIIFIIFIAIVDMLSWSEKKMHLADFFKWDVYIFIYIFLWEMASIILFLLKNFSSLGWWVYGESCWVMTQLEAFSEAQEAIFSGDRASHL